MKSDKKSSYHTESIYATIRPFICWI